MTERVTILSVISVLALAGIGLCTAAYLLARVHGDYAPFLTSGTGLLGVIGGMLASTRTKPETPTPVSGPAGGNDPVNVEVHSP